MACHENIPSTSTGKISVNTNDFDDKSDKDLSENSNDDLGNNTEDRDIIFGSDIDMESDPEVFEAVVDAIGFQ